MKQNSTKQDKIPESNCIFINRWAIEILMDFHIKTNVNLVNALHNFF